MICLSVRWDSISSQVLGPSSLIFSGYVRVICGSAQFEFEPDPLKLTAVLKRRLLRPEISAGGLAEASAGGPLAEILNIRY